MPAAASLTAEAIIRSLAMSIIGPNEIAASSGASFPLRVAICSKDHSGKDSENYIAIFIRCFRFDSLPFNERVALVRRELVLFAPFFSTKNVLIFAESATDRAAPMSVVEDTFLALKAAQTPDWEATYDPTL
jgi:hypothetical protein